MHELSRAHAVRHGFDPAWVEATLQKHKHGAPIHIAGHLMALGITREEATRLIDTEGPAACNRLVHLCHQTEGTGGDVFDYHLAPLPAALKAIFKKWYEARHGVALAHTLIKEPPPTCERDLSPRVRDIIEKMRKAARSPLPAPRAPEH